jgi:hypothetical protein
MDLRIVTLVLLLSLINPLDGAATISPLPPQYWVQAYFKFQNSSSLTDLRVYPLESCVSAASFSDYIGGSINESRFGIFTNGKLDFSFCNSTDCTNCSSFTTNVPLNQFSSNGYGYTMFLANQLPPIQPRTVVYTIQQTYTCPAASNYIQYIVAQSTRCLPSLDGTFGGMTCNETGSLVVSQCSDNQCLRDCKVEGFGAFGPCGYGYCIGDLSQGVPVVTTTPNTIPGSTPSVSTPVASPKANPSASVNGSRLQSIDQMFVMFVLASLFM